MNESTGKKPQRALWLREMVLVREEEERRNKRERRGEGLQTPGTSRRSAALSRPLIEES